MVARWYWQALVEILTGYLTRLGQEGARRVYLKAMLIVSSRNRKLATIYCLFYRPVRSGWRDLNWLGESEIYWEKLINLGDNAVSENSWLAYVGMVRILSIDGKVITRHKGSVIFYERISERQHSGLYMQQGSLSEAMLHSLRLLCWGYVSRDRST